MRPTIEPEVGQRVYVFGDDGDGQPRLVLANYVHRHKGWRRYRNVTSGIEWNENGLRWWTTIGQALAEYVHWKAFAISANAATEASIAAATRRIVTAVHIARRETQAIEGRS